MNVCLEGSNPSFSVTTCSPRSAVLPRVELLRDDAATAGLLDDRESVVFGGDDLDLRVDVSRVDDERARVRTNGVVLLECRRDAADAFGVCALADPLARDRGNFVEDRVELFDPLVGRAVQRLVLRRPLAADRAGHV